MPQTITVKVNTIEDTVLGDYNYKELKGYDSTNNKNITKRFFAEKKNGGPTQAAMVADTCAQGDWVDLILDDSSYHNVQSMKKVGEPAGGAGPSADTGASAGAPASSVSKKTGRTVGMLNREKALESAVAMVSSDKPATGAVVKSMEKLAFRMEAFLVKGDFNADLQEVPVPEQPKTASSDPSSDQPGPPITPEDDDIPF